jgi:hypothetical protein
MLSKTKTKIPNYNQESSVANDRVRSGGKSVSKQKMKLNVSELPKVRGEGDE